MAMREHAAETGTHSPSEKFIHKPPAWQFVFDPVGEARLCVYSFKLVPVNPFRKRPADLFVDKQLVLFVCGMQRHPAKYSRA